MRVQESGRGKDDSKVSGLVRVQGLVSAKTGNGGDGGSSCRQNLGSL